jgi:hypothetical protein
VGVDHLLKLGSGLLGKARNSAPGQAVDEVTGRIEVQVSVGLQPIGCAHLSHAGHSSARQFRFYKRQFRFLADGLGNGTGKGLVKCPKARTYIRVVYEAGFKDEAVGPIVTVGSLS